MQQDPSFFLRPLLLLVGALGLATGCGGDSGVDPGDAATSDVSTADVPDSGVVSDTPTPGDVPMATDTGHSDDAGHGSDAAHGDDVHHGSDAAHTCMAGDTVYVPMGPHWDYTHQTEWPMLMGSMCAGMTQTPIDIPMTTTPETTGLTFNHYGDVPLRLVHNGHTLQVNVSTTYGMNDPSVSFGGTTYYLLQFHAHTTSEHTVRGMSYPMEVHFVHATDNTPTARFLVVGVLFTMGADNPVMETVLTQNPGEECQRERLMTQVNLSALLPANRSHFHYSPGSLTTPPCTMGLNWFVLSTPIPVGMTQVSRFAATVHGHNNRSVQPLNMRTVYEYTQPLM